MRSRRIFALEVRAGFEAAERGEFEQYDERTTSKLADESKSRGRRRLPAKDRQRTPRVNSFSSR